jgi:hypothetical protein
MKMSCMILFGSFLILIGIGIVIRVIFHIDIPVFKILVALFFMYLGIRLLMGRYPVCGFNREKGDIIFSEARVDSSNLDKNEHNVVFSSALFDLSKVELKDKPVFVKINTVFGNTRVKIKRDMPVKIVVDAAFSGAKLPNGNSAAFGTTTFSTENFKADSSYLYIKADVVFSGFEVYYVD